MALIRKVAEDAPRVALSASPRDYAGLVQELDAPRADVRRWAAKDLGDHPQAVPDLCGRLASEGDGAVRDGILSSLVRIGGTAVIDGVVPLLRSEDAGLRNGVIEVLKALPDDTAERIAALLRDPDPDVRIFAINVLESLRHPGVEAWLIEVLEGDDHENVCTTAIDLLAEVGTPVSVPVLQAVRHRFDSEFVRFACALALTRIGAS